MLSATLSINDAKNAATSSPFPNEQPPRFVKLAARLLDPPRGHPRRPPCALVCREHAELANVGECLDFRLPQRILAAAAAVDRSRPVISVARLTRRLLSIAVWSSALTAISQGLFRSTCAVTPGIAILPEKRSEVRNVIGAGH